MKPRRELISALLASAILLLSAPSIAAKKISNEALLSLSLEEVMNLKVTSVSRKSQRLMDSAASVYIITQDDIQRSGVTTIPDALRMVPGLQVAQMNSNTWSISARGFNYIFANKLLVMMDGRTIYNPLFSGVNWDVQDTLLQDIDRIEVIKGPGAALWGANAMNGVINIITKSASQTQGNFLQLGAGNQEKAFGSFRHGGQLGDKAYYRAYYKTFHKDGLADQQGNEAFDDWKIDRAGFRVDWQKDSNNEIKVQSELYNGTTRSPLTLLDINSIPVKPVSLLNKSRDQQGGHILAHWTRTLGNNEQFSLKTYFDRYDNDDYRLKEQRDTFDIESQHRFQWSGQQELIWGLGYRSSWYTLSKMNYVTVNNTSPREELYSAYIQDEITLSPKWQMTLSARLEHHTSTGYEFQPNARLLWSIDARSSAWAVLSRAVRTPAVTERDSVNGPISDPRLPQGSYLLIGGNQKIKSEVLTGFDIGYRRQLNNALSIDLSSYVYQYDDLHSLSFTQNCPSGSTLTSDACLIPGNNPPFSTYALIPALITNGADAKTYGLEIATNWQPTRNWHIKADITLLQVDARSHTGDKNTESLIEGLSANQSANIRSFIDLTNNWQLNLWLRHVGKNKAADINSYTTFDMKLAYQWSKGPELSLVGINLFDQQRKEFDENFTGLIATEPQRSWYAQLTWQY
ncbi:hypothetical protein GZ77_24945 [Endozoicomonas montiporae]|uniref:TonB-dependent receptor n=2 Tax=Endozoicomonas montiporae TaxID=1027273 RepID=A0A081MYU4_9GAMM|nr:TonB-dependent receptor [Endozoicomonas montiporae]AMO54829.1 ligand-gated TonB-dependent outer membrane channel [Endozoicomonas montiporae CL-33]KEQ11367.1 hypothetical protein GZ77_24945 [Endozoicomonas montiporae]